MTDPAANSPSVDVAVVGAGAAGLATAIFARRAAPALNVLLLEGARRPGAKILVSGGSRCNVTNARVNERDFWGGLSTIVRKVLRAFPVEDTVAFFREIGVRLHEEADGKLFPDTNRSRDVLEALLREAGRVGVTLAAGQRVLDVTRTSDLFRVDTAERCPPRPDRRACNRRTIAPQDRKRRRWASRLPADLATQSWRPPRASSRCCWPPRIWSNSGTGPTTH